MAQKIALMRMIDEFKQFIARGNVIDLAVGVVIGTAFGVIVSSLVDDLIMPPLGWLLANINFATLRLIIGDPQTSRLPSAMGTSSR